MKRIIGLVALFLMVSIFSNLMISANEFEESSDKIEVENNLQSSKANEGYIVTFDPDDGVTGYADFYKVTVPVGGKVTSRPEDPKRDGYFFKGWMYAYDESGNPLLWNFESDIVVDNTTLWAVWEQGCIVAFDPDDGVIGYADFYKVTVPVGGKVTSRPEDPKRDGYFFKGWMYAYDESGKPLLWNFESNIVVDNTTLWAVWEQGCIVAFDPDDGVTGYTDFYKVTVPVGGKVTSRPEDPKRDGYFFKGWMYAYDENEKPLLWNFENDIVMDNTTLWAVWEVKKPQPIVDTIEKPVIIKTTKNAPTKPQNIVRTSDTNKDSMMNLISLLGVSLLVARLYSKKLKR